MFLLITSFLCSTVGFWTVQIPCTLFILRGKTKADMDGVYKLKLIWTMDKAIMFLWRTDWSKICCKNAIWFSLKLLKTNVGRQVSAENIWDSFSQDCGTKSNNEWMVCNECLPVLWTGELVLGRCYTHSRTGGGSALSLHMKTAYCLRLSSSRRIVLLNSSQNLPAYSLNKINSFIAIN